MRPASLARRARAWGHVAQSALRRRLDPGWVPLPHAAHLLLTWRCSLRCTHCPSWRTPPGAELSAAEWRALARQLRSLDVVKVLGGEPLLREDAVDIVAALREEVDPVVLQLTTNGMHPRRLVALLHATAWPGLQLRLSIDGLGPTHDRSRGVPGSFDRVLATAREVAALRPRYGFQFGINFALTDDSAAELEGMLRLAEGLDADLIPGVCVEPFLVSPTLPEEQSQRVVGLEHPERALAALRDARWGTVRELWGLEHRLSRRLAERAVRDQLRGTRRFGCRELRDLAYILPDGKLVRCGLDHRPIADLRELPFEVAWRSPAAEAGRCTVDACPGCAQASVHILSRLYRGDWGPG